MIISVIFYFLFLWQPEECAATNMQIRGGGAISADGVAVQVQEKRVFPQITAAVAAAGRDQSQLQLQLHSSFLSQSVSVGYIYRCRHKMALHSASIFTFFRAQEDHL